MPAGEPLPAPDFTLASLDGQMVHLADLRDRWVILTFWASWLDTVIYDMSDLQQFADAHADRVTVLGINVGEDAEIVRAFATVVDVHFPLLLNPDETLLSNYFVTSLPVTLMIAPSGNIVYRQFGPLDPDFATQLTGILN
ncbi:MAG: TlpA family protein disulfide reductase [Anaerolineae bacterium]|nr:TlpA family protein disulfide reductase [Anaerolineae bacterium]